MENTLASGLNELGTYYKENHLRSKSRKYPVNGIPPKELPSRPQTECHLKRYEALDHTHSLVYLGITLDRSPSYGNHCLKTRAKLSSRNNLLRKLHGTNWGVCPHTMNTTATGLTMTLHGGVLLSCLGPFHASQARRHNSIWMHLSNCYSRSIRAVRHRPTGNKAQRPQPKRAHQTTDRPATQPSSPPARERPPTLAQQFHLKLPASPMYASRSACHEVAGTVGGYPKQPEEV